MPFTAKERLKYIVEAAEAEIIKYKKRGAASHIQALPLLTTFNFVAHWTGWALNIAIGLQVLLGALTTAVSAATSGRQVRLSSPL
jgi:hypothetical protein